MTRKKTILIVVLIIAIIVSGYIVVRRVFRLDRFGTCEITWVDAVKIKGTTYVALKRIKIDNSEIDKKIGNVKYNVSHNVKNPNYRLRNGDATHLSVGTMIFSLKSDDDAIAIKYGGFYYLYLSDPHRFYSLESDSEASKITETQTSQKPELISCFHTIALIFTRC